MNIIELYKKAGLKDEGVLFLINEGHITNEKFLVYINDLLSSGEIADLYNEDDKMAIVNAVRGRVKAEGRSDTPDDCWAFFIEKIQRNLHVTLCFSPVGDTFRTRARRFRRLNPCAPRKTHEDPMQASAVRADAAHTAPAVLPMQAPIGAEIVGIDGTER